MQQLVPNRIWKRSVELELPMKEVQPFGLSIRGRGALLTDGRAEFLINLCFHR